MFRRDAQHVLEDGLESVDGVRGLDIQGGRLALGCLHEDLHVARVVTGLVVVGVAVVGVAVVGVAVVGVAVVVLALVVLARVTDLDKNNNNNPY